MDPRAASTLALETLGVATPNPRPHEVTIHHSDQDCQYTPMTFGSRLESLGLLGSMGSLEGGCDGFMAEGLMATLETGLLKRNSCKDRNELSLDILDHIEGFYNRLRRHSVLGYLSLGSVKNSGYRKPQEGRQHTNTAVSTKLGRLLLTEIDDQVLSGTIAM